MGFFTTLWNKLAGSKTQKRILMVGLDGAGKTSVLYLMKLGEYLDPVATVGYNVEEVEYNNITFTIWDLGGQEKIRGLWRNYYAGVDGVIFVVDSSDSLEGLLNAKTEIQRLLQDEQLKNSSLLVLANKKDNPNSKPAPELVEILDLNSISRPWNIQSCCAKTGEGIYEGLDWLTDCLKSKR